MDEDLEEMERTLREAGLYEENMTREQVVEYYKAVADSKDTATSENVSREIKKSSQQISSEEDILQNDFILDAAHDATKANIGFNDMHEATEKLLKIYVRPRKYVNIQNSEQFLSADLTVRSMMLYSYHTKIARLLAQRSRQSFYAAPLPKPIIIKEETRSNPIKDVTGNTYDESNCIETYISRSGRQTKRKTYNEEDDDSVDAMHNKKRKSIEYLENWEDDIPLKVTDSNPLTLSKPGSSKESTEELKNAVSEATSSPAPKGNIRKNKKLTNAEIMEKCPSLFSSSPRTKKPRKTRCELMFDTLKEGSVKIDREAEALEAFEKTLVSSEDIESQQEEISVVNNKSSTPKTISHLGRKGIHSKKNYDPLISTENGVSSTTKTTTRNTNVISNGNKINFSEITISEVSSSSRKKDELSTCPICNNEFPESEIVAHASSCGDTQDITRYTRSQSLTCEICEKVIMRNYEEHVASCKRKHEGY